MINDSFLWTPYDEHRLGPNAVPNDIFTRANLWNAPSPLISFECIEWCPTDRVMRQFGLAQGIPGEPRSLGTKHNECLTGPKGKNWRNEYRDWIGEWLNRVPAWHWNDPPPVGVPLDEYVTWHNGNYNAFLHLSAFDANQGQQGDSGGSEEEQEQPQQAYHAPHRSPTPVYVLASQEFEEQVSPPHESVPPPSSFPESSAQQLSSYPLFMNTVAPFLSDHMDPHAFNTLYSMVGEFDRAQRARAMEENQPAAQHPDQTIPGRLSVDSHFNAPAASGHSAARQSFDSSRSFNRRGIGEDGVHRPGSVPHVDLNFNVSWSQEGDEAARYTRFRDTDQCNSNDNDMDEDEEED
ncbi:hypothetical protein PIB30_045368 [Stylosanthes scabra]|uniref:Aminotransferase-like plant mobile domain-containing protein n=1 Tax=Stylosanthes scabra TaxID=79078 RepID=A0ABU6SG04_9FABA|nr:hypothetical protein [Stylosanthes scabra]